MLLDLLINGRSTCYVEPKRGLSPTKNQNQKKVSNRGLCIVYLQALMLYLVTANPPIMDNGENVSLKSCILQITHYNYDIVMEYPCCT